jgi:hypothetical protein
VFLLVLFWFAGHSSTSSISSRDARKSARIQLLLTFPCTPTLNKSNGPPLHIRFKSHWMIHSSSAYLALSFALSLSLSYICSCPLHQSSMLFLSLSLCTLHLLTRRIMCHSLIPCAQLHSSRQNKSFARALLLLASVIDSCYNHRWLRQR